MVEALIQEAEVGKTYTGKVKTTTAFGAFVEILPGVEGLVHISELQHGRTDKTEDVVKKGDVVTREAARGGRARPAAPVAQGVDREGLSADGPPRRRDLAQRRSERPGDPDRADAVAALGGGGLLGQDGVGARAARADGRVPSARAHGLQGHPEPQRAGHRGGPGESRRRAGRLHRPRPHHLSGADAGRGSPARAGSPHRYRAAPAAPGGRPRPRAQRGARGDRHGRGHAGRPGLRPACRRAVALACLRLPHPRAPARPWRA